MEDFQDSSFNGPSAMSIATELKDEFYFKLVDDFFGPQTGDLLDLNEKPCTNRLLVQVGLMREERDVPWVNVVKWLQKILPKFDSADFRGLINRNIETALSLRDDVRETFFESPVNFEFVGPICDSIGIRRRDLLDMSDFSDRAKLTDVTNGLILELTNFIAQEKLDPVILVSWLRNFDSNFCSDGKIQKANKVLQASLRKFWVKYQNCQRSRQTSSELWDEFLQTPFEIAFNPPFSESNKTTVFKKRQRKEPLDLDQEESVLQTLNIKEESEPVDISEHNLSSGSGRNYDGLEMDSENENSYLAPIMGDVKEEYDSCSVSSDSEQSLEDLEETPQIDTGDCVTLLDTAFLSLQKLTEMYGGKNKAKKVSMDILKNHFSLMLKKDSKMNRLNDLVMAHALMEEDQPVLPPLNFLQYITHFLFDFVDAVEKQIMFFEREIINNTGDKLGRDKNPRFRSFLNFFESAVTRYVNMACEILCPREETDISYRRHWLAFCLERNNPSKLPVNQSNRFINYFEAVAGLIHHQKDVALFVSDLQQLKDDSNIILDSVNDDASDEAIQTLVCVVAIVYCKVLGPFWQLLKSEAQYLLFSRYIFCLYEKLLQWSQDVSVLLQPEAVANVFLQVPMQEKTFSGVFAFCQANADNQYGTLMKVCLQRMMKVLAAVVEEDLRDFLPGGKYCKEPSEKLAEDLAGCKMSQLMGEYPFGHTYACNKTGQDQIFVQKEGIPSEESEGSLSPSHPETSTSSEVPRGSFKKHRQSKPYIMFERANLQSLDRLEKKKQRMIERTQWKDEFHKKMIIAAVTRNGGPCKSVEDVDRLLVRLEGVHHAQKRAAIRCELTYQNLIVGSTNTKLNPVGFSLTQMVTNLKALLPSEKSSNTAEPTNILQGVNQSNATAAETIESQENPIIQ